MIVVCPYCSRPAKLVCGSHIYPHRPDLEKEKFWRCDPCGAHCGVHPRTETPLGSLADSTTRKDRNYAHNAFDPLWKNRMWGWSRSRWYGWLAQEIGLRHDDCHIGQMNSEQCKAVEKVCQAILAHIRKELVA